MGVGELGIEIDNWLTNQFSTHSLTSSKPGVWRLKANGQYLAGEGGNPWDCLVSCYKLWNIQNKQRGLGIPPTKELMRSAPPNQPKPIPLKKFTTQK